MEISNKKKYLEIESSKYSQWDLVVLGLYFFFVVGQSEVQLGWFEDISGLIKELALVESNVFQVS